MKRQRPLEGFIGRDLAFGEALWSGPVKRALREPPWHSLRNYRAVSLGPVVRGRAPVLLVLGGSGIGGYVNGVWRSLDEGATWEEVSPNDEGHLGNDGRVIHRKWCGRESFAAAAGWTEDAGRLRGLVYVIGGLGPSSPLGDVWASEDLGKTFQCLCPEAPFGRRVGSGLAVCPGFPQRLVLVGGGWGQVPERWDCWLSLDVGEHWTEVEVPDNCLQRRQPTLFFPWRGTLVVLGGRDQENGPSKEAHVAKVQWQRRTMLWRPLEVEVQREREFQNETSTSMELCDLSPDDRPWFLSHFTVYDHRTGEFIGISGPADIAPLVVGRLPKRLLLGPLERTPGKTARLKATVRSYPSRLPGDEDEDVSAEDRPSDPLEPKPAWQIYYQSTQPKKHLKPRELKARQAALECIHGVLAADAARLFFLTNSGVWSSSGYWRQVRMLQMLGQQAHARHGLVPEVWHRVLVHLLGGRRCQLLFPGAGAGGAAGDACLVGSTPLPATTLGRQVSSSGSVSVVADEVLPLEELPPDALAEHEHTFSIVGTWDNFEKPHKMAWDGSSFVFFVTIGQQAWESFQILQDGRWELALYPSVPDGNPFVKHVLMGPDAQGHGKNWTIGRHESDKAPRGSCYRVQLKMWKHSGRPGKVEWKHLGLDREADEAKADTMRRVLGIAKAREDWRRPSRPSVAGLATGSRSSPQVEEMPWNSPVVGRTAVGGSAPSAPATVPPRPMFLGPEDLREPLLLLGTCNNWNVEEAKEHFRFKRFSGGPSQGYQESRLIVRSFKEVFEFQVVSAKRLWDWRIYPSSRDVELERGVKDRVQAGLLVGADHTGADGKNFRVRKNDDKVYVMVSLSEGCGVRVWCE